MEIAFDLFMSRVIKYVSVFFFWLAGLTLCAHMLIPHDHHVAEPNSTEDKNCPATDNNSGHKSGFPLHCHAFNDLAVEKVRLFNISQNIQFSFSVLSVLTDSDTPDLQDSWTTISDFQKPVPDSFALEFTLLRAPPSIA